MLRTTTRHSCNNATFASAGAEPQRPTTTPERRVLSRPSNTRKSTARSTTICRRLRLRLGNSWRKSTTRSACILPLAIVRRWSSSEAYCPCERSGRDEHESFSRHKEIYRSDVGFGKAGEQQLSPLPALIGFDEFPVGYSLAGCPPAEPTSASPTGSDSQRAYNDFSANGNNPSNSVSQPKGALH